MKIKLLIATLILATNLFSQDRVKRMSLHDSTEHVDFTRRWSANALVFDSPLCCNTDSIYISVLSDSVNLDRSTFNLYAYFPMNINPDKSVMILKYTDNTDEILYQINKPDEDNYVEYHIVSNQYRSIFNKKVESITLRGIGTFKLKDKSFFMDFYNLTK